MPDANDLLREMDAAGVDRMVLVPPLGPGGAVDNEAALDAARRFPDRFCAMVRILPREAGSLETLARLADRQGVRGVRLSFTAELAGLPLTDEALATFWSAAEALGLAVALNAPGRADEVAALATSFPRLGLLLDHLGLAPRRHAEDLATALAPTLDLAALPNVAVKATGLVARLAVDRPLEDFAGCLAAAVAAFGPERVFWGSDLSNLDWPYPEFVAFSLAALDSLGPGVRAQVMGEALARRLRWGAAGEGKTALEGTAAA